MKLSTQGTNGYVVSLKMFTNIQYRALCSVAVSILYLQSIKQNEKKENLTFVENHSNDHIQDFCSIKVANQYDPMIKFTLR